MCLALCPDCFDCSNEPVKIPTSSDFDAVAAIVNQEFAYTDDICPDWLLQSALESWMMQRLSIHKYRIPSFRVKNIASLNVLGSSEATIPDLPVCDAYVCVVNKSFDLVFPQQ